MGIARGYSTVKSVYRESAWGTPVTPANAYGINVQSIQSNVSQNLIDDPTMSSNRKRFRAIHGNIDAGFTITVTVNPEQIGFWLAMCFGLPTTTGETAPYTHAFQPSTLPSFTLEQDFTAEIATTVIRYTGCRVASGTFTIPLEGPVTLTMQCQAKAVSLHTAALDNTPTVPEHRPWSAREAQLQIDSAIDCRVKGMTINFNNELESIYTLSCATSNYGERSELTEGRCVVNGSLDLVFSSAATMTKALARTASQLYPEVGFGTGTGAEVGLESLAFNMPTVDFGVHSPSIETRAGLSVTVPFEAYATGNAYSIAGILKSPRTATVLYCQELT